MASRARTVAPRLMLAPADVAVIVGKRGTGKSTAAKDVCAQALAQGARVVAFDPHDEYSRGGRESSEVRLGPLRSRVALADLLRAPGRFLDFERVSLAVVPREEPDAAAEDFVALSRIVASTGELVFVADEVGYWGPHCAQRLDWLATQSRHAEVPVVLVAQRLTQIPKTARTQATHLVSFRQDNPDDLKALEQLAGADFAAGVSRLGRGEWMHWRDAVPSSQSPSHKEK